MFSKDSDGKFSEYKGKMARLDKNGNVKHYRGDVGGIVNALSDLQNGSQFANDIITRLQSSENNFNFIVENKEVNRVQVDLGLGNGRTGILNNNAYAFQVIEQGKNVVSYSPFNNIGSGGDIIWNPKTGIIGLGHELGHAYDANFGMLDSRRISINGGTEEIREVRGVYYENRIRQDLDKRLRPNYSGPSLLDGNKNPIYYQGILPTIMLLGK
ncbi:hypothetical protein GR160_07405 [Flavobacterium sp. Sd200]|uniref:hypothetical protein n=1 Tax=Flavobacterium sp. Sd200 TaxID=2692211 RepID=UPI00136B7F85|nr:hypothetical protein [Flavobacterium sp. Sd200]MXN91053.1 hypothetical protein [Flavobacterium sp. Sd200]